MGLIMSIAPLSLNHASFNRYHNAISSDKQYQICQNNDIYSEISAQNLFVKMCHYFHFDADDIFVVHLEWATCIFPYTFACANQYVKANISPQSAR